jgi:dipeptidase
VCDSLVTLTDDGPLFAKNSDRDVNEAQVLRWYPAADHASGARVSCTWIEIEQVPRTHAVLVSQPWWMWGAEIGANEHGVVVGNEAVFTRRTGSHGSGADGLLGMDLLRLALERATDAEGAVATIVGLLERHGQNGSCSHEHPRFRYDNSFLVVDREQAIVLETAGQHWATENVSGRGRSLSNGLTIPAFAKAHADPIRGRVAACATRQRRTQAAAAKADSPGDLMAALRDHGDTGPRWSAVNGALAAPCAHAGGLLTSAQSTAPWVADLRGGTRHWVTGTSAPCTSVFKPVDVATPLDVDPGAMPDNHMDPAYRWWRHEQLHRLALRDLPASLARFTPERDRLEAEWLAEPPDSLEAFVTADAVEAQWLADLETADLPDSRPVWLRRQWRGQNRAADVPA